MVAREEGPPLGFPLKCKLIAETDGYLLRQWGLALLEGPTDGFRQVVAFEREGLRNHPEVVEILHAAVCNTERYDSFSLLGNDGFGPIGGQTFLMSPVSPMMEDFLKEINERIGRGLLR